MASATMRRLLILAACLALVLGATPGDTAAAPPHQGTGTDFCTTPEVSDRGVVRAGMSVTLSPAGSPYLVDCFASVEEGGSMTVQPGVRVEFGSSRRLDVKGNLVLGGTAPTDILLTSNKASKTPGDWAGLYLRNTATASMAGFTTEYAGNNSPAITIEAPAITVHQARIAFSDNIGLRFNGVGGTLSSAEITDNRGAGLQLSEKSGQVTNVTISGTVFTRNALAVDSRANVQLTLAENVAKENGVNAIQLSGSVQSGPMIWRGGDLPIVLGTSVTVQGQRLTIEPNTIVKLDRNAGITMSAGELVAAGTIDGQIYFTALSDDDACLTAIADRITCDTNNDGDASAPSPIGGNWGRIQFGTTSTGGQMSHTVVRYGSDAAITIQSPSVTLSNGVVSNSGGNGIRVSGVNTTITSMRLVQNRGPQNRGNGIQLEGTNPVTMTVRDSVFEQNGYAALKREPNVDVLSSGNSTPGFTNGINGYVVESGRLTQSQTWRSGDLPYVVEGLLTLDMSDAAQTLSLQAGLTVKVADRADLKVSKGILRSMGTPENIVLVTSLRHDACADGSACDTNGDGELVQPTRGSWGSIIVERTSRGAFLPSARILYGGSRSTTAAVVLQHSNSSIEGAEVAESGAAGILVEGVNQTLLADNVVHHNAGAGLALRSSNTDMKVRLERNTMHDNGGAAIDLDANVEAITVDNTFPTGNQINGLLVRGQARISRTWHPSNMAYYVPDNVQVINRDARLIVLPGTVIKFESDAYVSVSGGSFIANGTAEDKIYFTSVHDDTVGGDTDGRNLAPSGWGYIDFMDTGQGGSIAHAEVRGAGTALYGALRVRNAAVTVKDTVIEDGLGSGIQLNYPGADATRRQPEIRDNVIRRQIGYGIEITAGTRPIEPLIHNNRIQHTGKAAIQMDANAQPDHQGNEAEGCEVNGILLTFSTLTVTRRWTAADLPYIIDRQLTVGGGDLQIDAGAVVKFRADAKLLVSRGRLTVPTSQSGSEPVTFTALLDDTCGVVESGCDTGNDGPSEPFRGYWGTIEVGSSSSIVSLVNIRVRYAGAAGASAALLVSNGLRLEDSVISDSETAGVLIRAGQQLVIRGNTFRDNTGVGLQFEASSSGIVDGNVFIGNGRSIELKNVTGLVQTSNNVAVGNDADAMRYCGNISEIQSWQSDLVREVVCSVTIEPGAALDIEPGVVLRLNPRISFRMSGRGTRLHAEGVLFTVNSSSETDSWDSLRYEKDSTGGLRYNYFIQGGSSSGMLDVQSNSPFGILYNTLLRTNGTGIHVHNNGNQEATVQGNLIRQVDGTDPVAIRVEQGNAKVQNNRIADASVGVRLNGSSNTSFVQGNSFSEINAYGIQNRDRTRCVEGQANWWGDQTGPYDPSRDPRDVCNDKTPGRELVNENGRGVPVTDWVDYQNWLQSQPPAAPSVDLPMCGVTSQRSQQVAGNTTPGATVNIYDDTSSTPNTPIATAVAGADGRFSTTVDLSDGTHKLSFAATKDGAAISARTGFRVIDVRSSAAVNPAGIRFEYGPYGQDRYPRSQPLRDEAGCAIACGGPSAGRVTLPAGEMVQIKVPAAAGVTGLEFLQDGRTTALRSGPGGVWTSDPFQPELGTFTLRASGPGAVDCEGYAFVGGAGFVFEDSGVREANGDPARPILSNDFEVFRPEWTSDPPASWQRTDSTAHSGRYSVSASNGPYAPNTNASFYVPVVDLRSVPAPQLRFWHKNKIGKGDRIYVEARTSATTSSWTKLAEWRESEIISWEGRVISLEEYSKVRTLWLRFRLQADSSPNEGEGAAYGWIIDDVSIEPGGRLNGRYDPGEPVLANASLLLLQRNLDTGIWAPWNGAVSNQSNPQTTDADGRYGFYQVPVGEYRVQVTPPRDSSLAPTSTRPIMVWNGAVTENIAVAGGEPLYFPTTLNRADIKR